MEPPLGRPDGLLLTLKNEVPELRFLRAAANDFAIRVGFPADRRLDLQLVLEEAVANVISHAWDGGHHRLEVRLSCVGEQIVAEVEDDGRMFDPLTLPAFDPDVPLELRRCGGMGVQLIRQLTDGLIYERLSGRNCLRMILTPRPAAKPDATHHV